MQLNARSFHLAQDSSQPLILVAIEDVTEQRTALRKLYRSETRYRRLVEEINSLIIGIDTTGRMTFFNRFSEKNPF
ncbi:hypothetical protein CHISP_2416 [Chitinispirillum alkaliphilum]|nr:hypothetical protein CHISP_2416 [Chitinispirillum alkaliphilum]